MIARRLAAVLSRHPRPWHTGTGDHWKHEVRDAENVPVAWFGYDGGDELAEAIVAIVNAWAPPSTEAR